MQSYYDPSIDLDRLRIQSEIHLEIDSRAISRAVAAMPARAVYTVLDVGCGNGFVTASRFSGNNFIVTAIDRNASAISEANKNNKYDNIEYYSADILDFYSEKPYNIIWCSQFLQHVSDVEKVLNRLWSLVSPDGVLICRNSDDGLDFTYPPIPDFEFIIAATDDIPNSSDRKIGRKLYNYFNTYLLPKPKTIDINFEVVSNLNKTEMQKSTLFDVRHGFRINAIKAYEERQDCIPELNHKINSKYFGEALAHGREKFIHDDTTLSFTVQFLATALKKGA